MIERLMSFGLSRQEAIIYQALYQQEPLSGYEVSKQTGISRSNVYSTLSALTDKGAAYLLEGNPSRYQAVNIDEFTHNYLKELQENRNYLIEHLKRQHESQDGYIAITGYKNILNKIQVMISAAKERVYLSVSSDRLHLFKPELEKCCQRGIKVVIISDGNNPYDFECLYYISGTKDTQLRLIVDSQYVLTGTIPGDGSDKCLYCAQENFVNVFKDALRNEIQLIQIKEAKNE